MITFSQTTKEIAQETLPVSLRKIKIAGGGIEHAVRTLREERLVKRIGSIISGPEDMRNVQVIIYALQGLLPQARDLGIKIEFSIYESLKDSASIKDLRDELLELIEASQLGEHVFLKEGAKFESIFKETDIFVGTSFEEPFNDYEIMAVLSRVPVIFPRTASRQSVLYQHKWVGESYFSEDARELKTKLLKLLINEQVYLNELQDSHQEIKDLHGMEAYFHRVIGFYERLYTKRLRHVRHRQKLNIS